MIWITSDTHYWHKNICLGSSVWQDKSGCRDFNSPKEMSDALVNSINKYVMQEDTLYDLGDWSFGGIENIWNFRKRINCKNIYLVPGNHDHHIKKNKLIECDTDWCYNNIKNFLDLSLPCPEKISVPAQQLFNILPELTKIVIDKQKFILSHYPIDEWEDMDRGSIMLHGHCHGNINDCETNTIYKRMDVGMDWKEFRPYSIDEIIKIMNKRKIKAHATK